MALGGLIALLYLLQPVTRVWGRLRPMRPTVSPKQESFSCPLQREGQEVFRTKGVAEVSREAFLEELRSKLWATNVRPRGLSTWDEADISCNSPLFWQAQMVSYEKWSLLYLRPVLRLRLPRLAVSALGLALVLFWSPVAGTGALVRLLAILLLEAGPSGSGCAGPC